MAVQSGGEVRDEKTLKVYDGGKPIHADEYDKDLQQGRRSSLSNSSATAENSWDKKNENLVGTAQKWTSKKQGYEFTPSSLSTGSVRNQEFGRDTNRLDFICVVPFDVYGGGGGRRDGGGHMTREAPVDSDSGGPVVQKSEQGRSSDVGVPVAQKLKQEMVSKHDVLVIQESNQESGNGRVDVGGGHGDDDQDEGCLVSIGCGDTWSWSWVCGRKSLN